MGREANDRKGAFHRATALVGGQAEAAAANVVLDHHRRQRAELEDERESAGRRGERKRARGEAREELGDAAREVEAGFARATLSVDRGEQLFHRPRGRRAERLVEMDRLVELLADQFVLAGEFMIASERLLDPLGLAPRKGSSRMPRQEGLDVLALIRLIVHRVHGQPLSIPAALSSSPSFFLA